MTIFFLLNMNFCTAIFVSHIKEENVTYILVEISVMFDVINYDHFYIIYVNIYTYV